MSTNKTLKRVALVAVASLGFGLVSVAPSQAADGDISGIVATANGGTAVAATATQVAGANNFVQYTVDVSDADTPMLISLSSSTATCVVADATKAVLANNGTAAVRVTSTAATSVTCTTPTTAAGTITVSVFGYAAGVIDATATSKLTITVLAAATGSVYSYSTATINNVAATGTINTYTNAATSAVTRYAKASAGNTVELYRIDIEQYDADDTGLLDTKTKAVTATLSGVGSLTLAAQGVDVDTIQATAGYVAAAAATANDRAVFVYADGRAGTSTLTIAVNGVTVKTYTFVFFGAAAAFSAAMDQTVIPALGTDGSVTVTVTDANGIKVPGYASLNFSSSDSTIATVAAGAQTTTGCAAVACTAAEWAAFGTKTYAVSGEAKGSATITVGNATVASGLATITTTAPVKVTGAQIASVSWAYDKTSYEPGEKATVTVTLKDSDGNPVGDDTYTLWATVPSADKNVTYIVAPAANAASVSGAVKYSFYLPFSSGAVNFTGKLATDADLVSTLHAVSPTLQTSVRNAAEADLASRTDAAEAAAKKAGADAVAAADAAADAAAEAIDAANAATDAANLAAEAADAATVAAEEARDAADAATAAVEELATQVATLMAALKAQIATLANTVAKIAKKVKA